MTDKKNQETVTETVQNQDTKVEQTTDKETGKVFTQAELDNIVKERLARESKKYEDYDSIQAKLKEYEDKDKTETDLLTERATKAEEELAKYKKKEERQTLLSTVATEKEVPESLWKLITADTEDEMKEQADLIMENFKDKKTNTKPVIKTDKGENHTEDKTVDPEKLELLTSLGLKD